MGFILSPVETPKRSGVAGSGALFVCLFVFKDFIYALVGVTQWIECWPVNQRVTGLVPSQGTCLGCRPGPQLGAHKRQPHIDVSPLFLPPFPSLSK